MIVCVQSVQVGQVLEVLERHADAHLLDLSLKHLLFEIKFSGGAASNHNCQTEDNRPCPCKRACEAISKHKDALLLFNHLLRKLNQKNACSFLLKPISQAKRLRWPFVVIGTVSGDIVNLNFATQEAAAFCP